jgi:YegS/Rv2252/BmrU family lipid kinase
VTNIHFIINPIAGSGNHKIDQTFLESFFNKDEYYITTKYSTYKTHTRELTKISIKEKADIIVACGGDGTINEVASCIIGTRILLGIIPLGSGNGLASNLKIPKNLNKAIRIIKSRNVRVIDIGRLNEKYFFSNTGVGFDAYVIKNYEESNNRKLISYIKAFFKSFKNINDTRLIEVTMNEETFDVKPFMIFISNSNELGYKVSLTPKASLEDGLLDILIVPKINAFKIVLFSLLMIIKKHHLIKEVKSIQTKQLVLHRKDFNHFKMQIDGEYQFIESNKINISITEKSLKVIS